MKRKISSTLAVTLIASNMQSLSFAEGNENLKELPKKEVNIVNENIVKSEDKNSDETKIEEIASKDEKPEEEVKNLNVSVDGYIPDDYVESDYEKLELYQRLDKAKTMSELNSLKAEFDDYDGNLPDAILTLIEKRKLEILSHYSIIEDIKDSGKQLEIIFSPNAFETISGDKLFLLANQLFTKPAFKSLDNKITIKINKHDQWLNRLNEFIETLSKK